MDSNEEDILFNTPEIRRRQGRKQTLDQLWEISHPELRRMAKDMDVLRAGGESFDADELYLIFVKQTERKSIGAQELLSQAPPLMRRLLLESVPLESRGEDSLMSAEDSYSNEDVTFVELGFGNQDFINNESDLKRALSDLAEFDPRLARVTELRSFAGFTLREVSQVLGISYATASRDWASAKRFLADKLATYQPHQLEPRKSLTTKEETTAALIEKPASGIIVFNLISQELLHAIRRDPRLLGTLGWREFEHLLAETLARLGYEVELQRGTKDGGIDIFAIRRDDPFGPHRYLLQAKKSRNAVGVNPVRELLFLHQHHRMSRSCLATTSIFTRGAWRLAGEYPWQLELKDAERLKEWIALATKKV